VAGARPPGSSAGRRDDLGARLLAGGKSRSHLGAAQRAAQQAARGAGAAQAGLALALAYEGFATSRRSTNEGVTWTSAASRWPRSWRTAYLVMCRLGVNGGILQWRSKSLLT